MLQPARTAAQQHGQDEHIVICCRRGPEGRAEGQGWRIGPTMSGMGNKKILASLLPKPNFIEMERAQLTQ